MTDAHAMPFPVSPQYRIRSDIAPLEGPHTMRDASARAYAEAKRDVLTHAAARHRVLAAAADRAGVCAALLRFAAVVVREQEVAAEHRAGTWLDASANALGLADAIAMRVQEDFVVMRAGLGAELLHVCFPSHWDPGSHAGSPLAALHAPVPHGERLLGASDNLLRAMIEKGPFLRWVWSVNAAGTLSQHPDEPRPHVGPGPLVDRLWFRVERQTTLPLPDLQRSVFTIRIFQAPLADVLRVERDRAARLAAAIGSMDEPLRRYKGLQAFGDRLREELLTQVG